MSLQNYLACLNTEHLYILHNDLVDAGIAHDFKGDWKSVFKSRRNESTGKRKKLYSALSKAKKDEINALIGVLVALYPVKRGL